MFGFKELKILDVTLIGNTINVKVENSDGLKSTCPNCESAQLKKIEINDVSCFDLPINGRFVKILFPYHTYLCNDCEKTFDAFVPNELGYYLTKRCYDEVSKRLSLEDIEMSPKAISEYTGVSEDDAEKLLDIIMLEHFISV